MLVAVLSAISTIRPPNTAVPAMPVEVNVSVAKCQLFPLAYFVVMPPNRTTLGSSDLTSPATVSTHTPSSSPLTTETNASNEGSKSISIMSEPIFVAPLLM